MAVPGAATWCAGTDSPQLQPAAASAFLFALRCEKKWSFEPVDYRAHRGSEVLLELPVLDFPDNQRCSRAPIEGVGPKA